MVRDEADVIGSTLTHLANEDVDGIIVADNRSTDGTRDILADAQRTLSCPLVIVDDPEVGYWQSQKMSDLAKQAVDRGATWVLPFDADELWYSHIDRLGGLVRNHVDERCNLLNADLYNHFPTAIDELGVSPFETIVWRQRNPGALPKVLFRWEPGSVIHQGNHGVTLPSGERAWPGQVELRHFPYRSAAQFVRKARNGAEAYRATDLPDHVGAHWRAYGDILDRHGEEALAEVFRSHFWFLSPVDAGLIRDPAPYLR